MKANAGLILCAVALLVVLLLCLWPLLDQSHIDYSYGSVVAMCHTLLSLFDQAQVPDEERRVALETLMTSLRMGDPRTAREQVYLLMAEIEDKHGLDFFAPEFKEYIAELRKSRK